MATNKRIDVVIAAVDKTKAAVQQIESNLNRLKSAASSVALNFGKLSLAAVPVVLLGKACIDAAIAAEKMDAQFKTVFGTLANTEMNYVREQANRLGLDIVKASDAFGRFAASAKGTSLEGEGVRKVFSGVAEATTALKLSTDEQEGIFRALSQMMSKGKVQAEELTGQLGERLPGALGIAANAMGVSKAELLKLTAEGKVMASDLLPKLADALHKEFGKAAEESAKGAQSDFNRFNNTLFEVKKTIGTVLMPAVLDMLTEFGTFAKDVLPSVISGMVIFTQGMYKTAYWLDVLGMNMAYVNKGGWKLLEIMTRIASLGINTPLSDYFKAQADLSQSYVEMYEKRALAADKRIGDLEKVRQKTLAASDTNSAYSKDQMAKMSKENQKRLAQEIQDAKNANKKKEKEVTFGKHAFEWANKYAKELEALQTAEENFNIKRAELNTSSIQKRMAEIEKEKDTFIDNWVMRSSTEEEYQRRLLEVNTWYNDARLKATQEHVKRLNEQWLVLAEAQSSLKESQVSTDLAMERISETEAERQYLSVFKERVELLKKNLELLNKSPETPEKALLLVQAKQKLVEVEKQVADQQLKVSLQDPYVAMGKSLRDYEKSASDVASGMAQAMTSAFGNMENALTRFVTTGKLSFKDFANAVIEDLVRIAIRATITAPLANMFGSFFPTSSAPTTKQAKGGIWLNGIQKFASGGVVMNPTLFPMANGATGLMGEAGPEAIMPLTRTSNGKLGVAAAGGGNQEVNVKVEVVNQTSQEVKATTGGVKFDGKQFVISTILENISNNGVLRGALGAR